MGGSLRRHKKYRQTPTRVGVKRVLKLRKASQEPSVLKAKDKHVTKRLGINSERNWNEGETVDTNYAHSQVVKNPNTYSSEQHQYVPLKGKKKRKAAGEETYSDDDEMRACLSKARSTGPEPPKRLSSHQRQIVEKLIAKHAENLEAMVWDTKLNSYQHSAGKLKKLIEAYHFWKDGERCQFRVPRKPPKRLRYYTDHLAG